MKVIYLAHKIRDPRGVYWMTQNIREAESVALELWRMGAAVICPGKNTFLFDGALPDDTWLVGDLEIIDRCDAVVMSPNWPDSVGARAERSQAEKRGIPVFEWAAQKSHIEKFIAAMPRASGELVAKRIVDQSRTRETTDHD